MTHFTTFKCGKWSRPLMRTFIAEGGESILELSNEIQNKKTFILMDCAAYRMAR